MAFPVWNVPLKHPVNIAYEAATSDLKDVNMIDPFHFDAYNEDRKVVMPARKRSAELRKISSKNEV